LSKHLEKFPTSQTHQLLADCYSRLQKDDLAFTHYSAALRLDPQNQRAIEGLNSLGRTQNKLDSLYNCISASGESSASAGQEYLDESDNTDNWAANIYAV